MNPKRVAFPSGMPSVRGGWWYLGAAAVATALLSSYVGLLHESIAHGDQMREAQRNPPNASPADSTVALSAQIK